MTLFSHQSRHPNVVILTTSNVTEKIDLAFVDRADIKQYIGPPSVEGIFNIYLSCLEELMKVQSHSPPSASWESALDLATTVLHLNNKPREAVGLHWI